MTNIDPRIKELLKKRGIDSEEKIKAFVKPSLKSLHNPFQLNGMKQAVERINQAIENQETVVIFGDYDADGVCASAILFKFLKSKGLEPEVFIPKRFEDGYGMSESTVAEIAENFFPDLVVTVDCGVTSTKEIETLTEIGIDVIVTDHHEPDESLPNCVVIDPKIKEQKYPFDSLCGAGVVLKLVQALGGKVDDFVDIAAIATIGDIVSLTDENRVIAFEGLKKLNSNQCSKGILELKKRLNIETLTSSDVAFKIVPRLNASGRMADAKLSFELLVAENDDQINELTTQIEETNKTRVDEIEKCNKEIDQELEALDFDENPAIVFSSKNFHQGIIGIIASKMANEFNRPTIIFSESEDGKLKGSCRSAKDIDIHNILIQMSDLCESVGGHKLAAGLTIKKVNFDLFKKTLNNKLKQVLKESSIEKQKDFDIEINERDLNLEFASQLELLEPTGLDNETPIVKLKSKNLILKQTSNRLHFQILVQNKPTIMCFFGTKFKQLFESQNEKNVLMTIKTEKYNQKTVIRAIARDIFCDKKDLIKGDEHPIVNAILSRHTCLNSKNNVERIEEVKFESFVANQLEKRYGTAILTCNFEKAKMISEKFKIAISTEIPSGVENVLVYAPKTLNGSERLKRYRTVIKLDNFIFDEQYFHNFKKTKVFVADSKTNEIQHYSKNLSVDRNLFGVHYIAIEKHIAGTNVFNDFYEFFDKVKTAEPVEIEQFTFCLFTFVELGFFEIDETDGFHLKKGECINRTPLESSKLFKLIASIKTN